MERSSSISLGIIISVDNPTICTRLGAEVFRGIHGQKVGEKSINGSPWEKSEVESVQH